MYFCIVRLTDSFNYFIAMCAGSFEVILVSYTHVYMPTCKTYYGDRSALRDSAHCI